MQSFSAQPYSARPAVRARQVVGDLVAIGIVVVAIWLAGEVTRAIDALARYGVQMQDAGSELSDTLTGAAEQLGDIPFVGDGISAPFLDASDTVGGLTVAGRQLEDAVHALALGVGTAVWLVPVLLVVVLWLVPRIRFARSSAETARIAATPAGRDLLALRALVAQPLGDLARVTADPLAAIRSGDDAVLDALAQLELDARGVARPRAARVAATPGR